MAEQQARSESEEAMAPVCIDCGAALHRPAQACKEARPEAGEGEPDLESVARDVLRDRHAQHRTWGRQDHAGPRRRARAALAEALDRSSRARALGRVLLVEVEVEQEQQEQGHG